MRILWTLLKVIIGLAVAIPLAIIVLATVLGVVGTLLALAILTLKVAVVGFVAYGGYRLIRAFFSPAPKPAHPERAVVAELPKADPYYEAAMRELDMELGKAPRL